MRSVRASTGQSRYVANEWDSVFYAINNLKTPVWKARPLVWCHGNQGTALGDYNTYLNQFRLLAQDYFVVSADLGGNTWGNDTGITRVQQVLDYCASEYGLTQKAIMFGASMGGSVALNYARVHPDKVEAVVGVIPALTLVAPVGNPAKPSIDAAYPPAYDINNETHRAHDPLNFASSLPADLPIGLWTSNNDPLCLPEYADTFVSRRPQTHRVAFGAYGHGGIDVATPLALDWLKQFRV